MNDSRLPHVILVSAAVLALSGSMLIAQPVPEFLGVYVVANDKLIELKPLQGSGYREMAGIGADRLTGSSGIVVDDAKPYFVIYVQGAASMTSIFLEEMKQLRYIAPDQFAGVPLESVEGNAWVGTRLGFNLRLAPMKENPEMMVRAVSTSAIAPGRYGLNVGSALYDLQIGQAKESCLVREGSVFTTGGNFKYTSCEEYFSKNPNAQRTAEKHGTQSNTAAIIRGQDTLHDSAAGQMWAARDNGAKVDWDAANDFCENQSLGGFDDWRLPSLEELRSIYVEAPGGSSSSNFGTTTIGASLSTCCLWTSTSDDAGHKQFFSFASGNPGRIMIKAIDLRLMRVLCVRQASQ